MYRSEHSAVNVSVINLKKRPMGHHNLLSIYKCSVLGRDVGSYVFRLSRLTSSKRASIWLVSADSSLYMTQNIIRIPILNAYNALANNKLWTWFELSQKKINIHSFWQPEVWSYLDHGTPMLNFPWRRRQLLVRPWKIICKVATVIYPWYQGLIWSNIKHSELVFPPADAILTGSARNQILRRLTHEFRHNNTY